MSYFRLKEQIPNKLLKKLAQKYIFKIVFFLKIAFFQKIFDMFKKILASTQKLKRTQASIAKWMQLMQQIKPIGNYGQLPIPTTPNYNNLTHWAVHPDVFNKSHFAPKGYQSQQDKAEADVFFIHPTTFFSSQYWNAPLEHPPSKEFIDEMIVPSQASVFNGACKVFAPRYRQATFYSFINGGKNARKALELAYRDVADAFDYYVKHFNKGRPFFIAGHSQGTLHGMRLLEEKVEHSDLVEQMIAAYLIGFRFPLDKMGTAFHKIKIAQHAKDIGCIIAWDTYGENGTPGHRLEKAELWYSSKDGTKHWKRRSYRKPLCVNPLTWTTQEGKAPKALNKGAVHVQFEGIDNKVNWNAIWSEQAMGICSSGLSAPFRAEVAAEIRKDNFLYVSKPSEPAFRRTLLPRANYHLYDYALFYMDIRANVIERLEGFRSK